MKTIGVLGGMSWESTQSYYRALNEGVKRELGGFHSAKVALVSVDFAEIETLQQADRWDEAGERLADAARRVQSAGADFLLLATNTMHRIAPAIEAAIEIPLLHIADATAERLRADGVYRVGLLGTRFTMEQAFYKDRLAERFGIEVLVPEAEQRERVHRVIFEELCQGRIEPASKVSRDHRGPARPRCRGGGSRLHRDRAADRPGRYASAALRHRGAARRGRGEGRSGRGKRLAGLIE